MPLSFPVSFPSGERTLRGRIFRPEGASAPLASFVVSGSWTSVKEQNPSAYAAPLAEEGFQVLVFDHSGFGQSDGFPRAVEDPFLKVADIRAAVDFLAARSETDRERLYGLGICAGGGYMLRAVAEDPRLRGLATVAAWMTDEPSMRGFFGAAFDTLRDIGDAALAAFAASGTVDYLVAAGPDGSGAAMAMDAADAYYVRQPQGAWLNRFAAQSFARITRFASIPSAAAIAVPSIFVHADTALLPDAVRAVHAALPTARKRLIWLDAPGQIAFYHQPDLIAASVGEIAAFFQEA